MEIYSLPTSCVAVPRLGAKRGPRRFPQGHSAADEEDNYHQECRLNYDFDPNEQPPERRRIGSNDGKELPPMICR